MRKAVMILLALLAIRLLPRALRQQARALELITLLFQIAAAAAANTSKTASTTARTASLETRVGNLEQGQFANLQGSSVLGQIQQGNFPGQSVSCASLTTTGNITAGNQIGVNGGAINWPGGVAISTARAAFVQGLSQLPHQTAGNATTFSNAAFTGLANAVNNLQAGLQGNGFEA